MRLVQSSRSEPAEVNRYLLPQERQVATLRQHWAFLVPPAAAAFGAALAAEAVMAIAPGDKTLEIVGWVLAGFLVARLIGALVSWSVRYITITDARVVLRSGVVSSRIKIIPLPNFAEMTFARSLAGSTIGFGTFIIEASGKAYLIIDYIPYSEQIQLILTERSLPKLAREAWNDDDDDDDEYVPPSRPDPFIRPSYGDYVSGGFGQPDEPAGTGSVLRAEPSLEPPPGEEAGDAGGTTDGGADGRQADDDDRGEPHAGD